MSLKYNDLNISMISLREPKDFMVEHELGCFKKAMGVNKIKVVNAIVDPLDKHLLDEDLLIFGGSGAFSVLDKHDWIKKFLDFLLVVAESNTLAWASCFGFQGLALAMGGKVVNDEKRQKLGSFEVYLTEEGKKDSVFKVLPERFHAQFGHHDHVVSIPKSIVNLAYSDHGEYQAFYVKGSNFWGAQFHPELNNERTWQRWEHYKPHYEGGQKEKIERILLSSKDTPNVNDIFKVLLNKCLKQHK